MSSENRPQEQAVPAIIETPHNLEQFQYKVVELLTMRPEDLIERVEEDLSLLEVTSDEYYEEHLAPLDQEHQESRDNFSNSGSYLVHLAENATSTDRSKQKSTRLYAKRLALAYEYTERHKQSLKSKDQDSNNGNEPNREAV